MGFGQKLLNGLKLVGIDLEKIYLTVKELPYFCSSLAKYEKMRKSQGLSAFSARFSALQPMLFDRKSQAGVLSAYFFQDLWAAKLVLDRHPCAHVDIGSRIDGFVAHLLPFIPVTVIDVRPLDVSVPNLSFVSCDATDLRLLADNSVESLSCLHALEHFGLGRYGDPVDPAAHQQAMREFQRVLAPEGHLYLSVPIGRQRLRFNAHRVFDPQTLINALHDLSLTSFAAVDDAGVFLAQAEPQDFRSASNACGMFDFTKT